MESQVETSQIDNNKKAHLMSDVLLRMKLMIYIKTK